MKQAVKKREVMVETSGVRCTLLNAEARDLVDLNISTTDLQDKEAVKAVGDHDALDASIGENVSAVAALDALSTSDTKHLHFYPGLGPPYKCWVCYREFDKKTSRTPTPDNSLEGHFEAVHRGTAELRSRYGGPYLCDNCGKSFKKGDMSGRKRHSLLSCKKDPIIKNIARGPQLADDPSEMRVKRVRVMPSVSRRSGKSPASFAVGILKVLDSPDSRSLAPSTHDCTPCHGAACWAVCLTACSLPLARFLSRRRQTAKRTYGQPLGPLLDLSFRSLVQRLQRPSLG